MKSCSDGTSPCTIRKAIHSRGVYFYAMRHKPLLTDQDIVDRHQFGLKYVDKPIGWWLSHIQMNIDVKFFQVFLNARARDHAAQSGCRGVYRVEGQGLSEGYYKPNPKLKYNSGAKGVHVLAGVGMGKVLVWEYLEGTWNSHEAARLYKGAVLKALQRAYPHRHQYIVLEDNDPTGFRSKLGLKAKEEARIETFQIPKRSPQLNVCDDFVWKEVDQRMGATERKWPVNKKETRDAYKRRLARTARSLPSEMISKAQKHMKVRCQRLIATEGAQIEG